MSSDDRKITGSSEAFSLKRWSRLKQEAVRAAERPAPQTPEAVAPPVHRVAPEAASAPAEPAALPDVESLDLGSDFTAFLRPEVDEGLKRRALKKLFSDPRFNVMDGLDVYIDDYTKSEPLAPDIARALADACSILDRPAPPDVECPAVAAEEPAEEQAVSAADALPLAQAQDAPRVDAPEPKVAPADGRRDANRTIERPAPPERPKARSPVEGSGA